MTNSPHEMIVGLAQHREDVLENLFGGRMDNLEASGLDAKTYSLANIAALIAMDAPPVSYVWQIGLALESGVTPEEILGLLVAVNPTVGNTRIVAAAPQIAVALGVDLETLGAQ